MKFVALLLFLALCSNSALSRRVQPRNLVTDKIRTLLENSRPNLVDIQVGGLNLGPLGSVQNATISGLDQFRISILEASLILMKVQNLTVDIDLVNMQGSYEVINATVPGVVTLNGKGNFNIDLIGVRISTVLNLKNVGVLQYDVGSIEILTIDVDLAKAVLGGIEGGDDTNSLISAILPDVISDAAGKLLQEHGQELVDAINGSL